VRLSTNKCSPNEKANTITLPARFTSLDAVRKFVVQAAKDCGMDQNAIDAVELAIDEAFSNIIEHAYGGESSEVIECSCRNTEDRLIIILKDCGKPFKPEMIPEPDIGASLENRKVGGLGMFFMDQLMDDVSYTFTTGPGGRTNCNELTLVKRKE
jgi:serine/threonine-protein kinase RsbW